MGVVVGGDGSKIRVRVRGGIGVGDLVYIIEDSRKIYYKVTNIFLSSEHTEKEIEIIAEDVLRNVRLFEGESRFYKIAEAKQIGYIEGKKLRYHRGTPRFFSRVFPARGEELKEILEEGIRIGKMRFGSEVIDVDVKIPKIEKVISHHILVSAATGKGKSNFAKVLLKGILEYGGNISVVVFDPHKEYWGRGGIKGLRDLPQELREKVFYYTLHPKREGGYGSLKVNPNLLEPSDFYGIVDFTETQIQALEILHKKWRDVMIKIRSSAGLIREKEYGGWLEILLKDPELISKYLREFFRNPTTFYILRRKMMYSLDLVEEDGEIYGEGVFDFRTHSDFFSQILSLIKKRGVIIIDTSAVGDICERILASAVLSRVFRMYKYLRQNEVEKWEEMPHMLILFEEAPRFIGRKVLEKGGNIFERVAREGRKFKVGLCAITQMPSLIPREILSQINTKIILGTPAAEDRRALVESSAQNIRDEEREIQMLDVGEAIITSPFVKFPYSIKIYNFEELVEEELKEEIEVGVG